MHSGLTINLNRCCLSHMLILDELGQVILVYFGGTCEPVTVRTEKKIIKSLQS